jgi:hypothetical protein
MKFLENRLIAVHECYFLMISISIILQYQSIDFASVLDFISSILCMIAIPYFIYFLIKILIFIQTKKLNQILENYNVLTNDLKFIIIQSYLR